MHTCAHIHTQVYTHVCVWVYTLYIYIYMHDLGPIFSLYGDCRSQTCPSENCLSCQPRRWGRSFLSRLQVLVGPCGTWLLGGFKDLQWIKLADFKQLWFLYLEFHESEKRKETIRNFEDSKGWWTAYVTVGCFQQNSVVPQSAGVWCSGKWWSGATAATRKPLAVAVWPQPAKAGRDLDTKIGCCGVTRYVKCFRCFRERTPDFWVSLW